MRIEQGKARMGYLTWGRSHEIWEERRDEIGHTESQWVELSRAEKGRTSSDSVVAVAVAAAHLEELLLLLLGLL